MDPAAARRQRPRRADPSHRRGAGQYTSIAFTGRLATAGVSGSVGTVGDAYDNALAESVIGLLKTGLIKPRRPWRTAEQVELATLEYVNWFNHQRLYEACGDILPAEPGPPITVKMPPSPRSDRQQTDSPGSLGQFTAREDCQQRLLCTTVYL